VTYTPSTDFTPADTRQEDHQREVRSMFEVVAPRYDLTLLTTDNDLAAIPGLAHENWLSTQA